MITESPPLYTPEVVVFRARVKEADLSFPISVFVDSSGNHAVVHGNHRAKKADDTGQPLGRTVIGRLPFDVSQNPNYKLVAALKIIEE